MNGPGGVVPEPPTVKVLDSCPVEDITSQYDMCMVLPLKDGKLEPNKGQNYVAKLLELDLDVYIYNSLYHDVAFVLVRASDERLKRCADYYNFKMLLDPEVARSFAMRGSEGIAPFDIEHIESITPYGPYESIYTNYSTNVSEDLYWRPEGETSPFRRAVRLKLMTIMIQERPNGRENIKIARYLKTGSMLGYFPLHDHGHKAALSREWLYWPTNYLSPKQLMRGILPWAQPMQAVREYFGEKVALFFNFFAHYLYWLIFPAVICIPVQINRWYASETSEPGIGDEITGARLGVLLYALCVSIWCGFMLEFWKRRCADVALEWGMIGFEENEADRPDFKGKMLERSHIDGLPHMHFPAAQRSARQMLTSLAVFLAISTVSALVAGIYVLKFVALGHDSSMQAVVSVFNAVQIQITNAAYRFVAHELTKHENYRTETQHEDALILKLFAFQFINSYSSFFFLAFVAKYIANGCGPDGNGACVTNLAMNLAIIFGTRLATAQADAFVVPYLTTRVGWITKLVRGKERNLFSQRELGHSLVAPEIDFLLDRYDNEGTSIAKYGQLTLDFGYTALFSAALPISSLLAFGAGCISLKSE